MRAGQANKKFDALSRHERPTGIRLMRKHRHVNITSVFVVSTQMRLDDDPLESVLSVKLSEEVDKCDFQRKASTHYGLLSS